MKKRVTFKETYIYDLEIEVYEDETVEDAIHETDMLIDRDKEWISQHRDDMHIETDYMILDDNDCINFGKNEESCTKLCDCKHCIGYMPKE